MSRIPIETGSRPEIAILFGSTIGSQNGHEGVQGLDELAGLAEAVEVQVAGRMVQRLSRPVAATYIGSGKVKELKALIGDRGANLALADMDLSPAQARNLAVALGVRVVDRSELIMDIFARRARTAQSKVQVELAQLQYALPRLRGQWSHLDRYAGGGVGTRGPGEKQIETDRRIVNRRVRDLKRRLGVFERRKQTTLEARSESRKVALAGYTNSGKSTLFNRLTGGSVYVADRLFATLDTRTRRWDIDGLGEILLSDTVGFIRALPHHLVASFHATLAEVIEADLILHVVDAADPEAAEHTETVRRVMAEIGAGEIPTVMVLNKADLVADKMDLQMRLNEEPGAVAISAQDGVGLDALTSLVQRHFQGRLRRMRARVPLKDGRSLAQVRELAQVLESRVSEETVELLLEVEAQKLGRLEAWARSASLGLERA